jgi:hypothetical protein
VSRRVCCLCAHQCDAFLNRVLLTAAEKKREADKLVRELLHSSVAASSGKPVSHLPSRHSQTRVEPRRKSRLSTAAKDYIPVPSFAEHVLQACTKVCANYRGTLADKYMCGA